MIHPGVALEMFEVVTSKSNASFLCGLSFKLAICKISKTQSDMCLNMPVSSAVSGGLLTLIQIPGISGHGQLVENTVYRITPNNVL